MVAIITTLKPEHTRVPGVLQSFNPHTMNSKKLRRSNAALSDANTTATVVTTLSRFAKALLVTVATATLCLMMAPAPANAAYTSDSKWFIDVGWLTHVSGDVIAMGADLRAGYYLNENNRIVLDLGYAADINPKVVGHFSYHPVDYPNETRTDGRIEDQHNLIPLMLSWEFEWTTANDLAWRLGPTAGITYISRQMARDPNLPYGDNVLRSDGGTAFLGGLNAGLRWGFSNGWYTDCSLAALLSKSVQLKKISNEKVNLSGGRFILSLGYRF